MPAPPQRGRGTACGGRGVLNDIGIVDMYGCVHGGIMDQQFFRFSYIRSVLKNNFSTSFGVEPYFQQLGVYQKTKTNVSSRKVIARLRTKTAFASFKRDYIRAHQSEYPKFQEYV